MSDSVLDIVEPFVKRGLFSSPEKAVIEMARDYILRQVEYYHSIIQEIETRHGMTYEQFEPYLKARSQTLAAQPSQALNQAVMLEEEDALEWKAARESLEGWLGLQREIDV